MDVRTGADDVKTPQKAGGDTDAENPGVSYTNAFELFRANYRNIFNKIDVNWMAVRNAGDRSVKYLKKMRELADTSKMKNAEKVAKKYVEKWNAIDPKRIPAGPKRTLKHLGNRVLEVYSPRQAVLKAGSGPTARETAESGGEGSDGEDSDGKESVKVRNPDQALTLYNKWLKTHDLYAEGIETNDPTLDSTFRNLRDVLEALRNQLAADAWKKRLSNFLEEYAKVFRNRKEYMGTKKKADFFRDLKSNVKETFGNVEFVPQNE